MLLFAGIAPHSHDLVKSPKQLTETTKALGELKKSLEKEKLDALLIISPRGTILQKGFAVNLAQHFEVDPDALKLNLEKRTYKSYPHLSMDIKNRRIENTESPVMLVSNKELDYGTATPLQFLLEAKTDLPIAPVFPSVQALPEHYAFGADIREVLMSSEKRFGLLVSADLALGVDGEAMDKELIADLADDNAMQQLQSIGVDKIQQFQLFGLAPLVMLAGIMKGLAWRYNQLSYERLSDQGLLVAELTLRS